MSKGTRIRTHVFRGTDSLCDHTMAICIFLHVKTKFNSHCPEDITKLKQPFQKQNQIHIPWKNNDVSFSLHLIELKMSANMLTLLPTGTTRTLKKIWTIVHGLLS